MFSLRRLTGRSLRASPTIAAHQHQIRSLHQSPHLRTQSPATELPLPHPRWVSNLVGKLRQAPGHENLLDEVRASAVALTLGVEGFGTKPFHVEPVTWGDMDAMGHVNNVIYNKWAESGRVDWVHKVTSTAPKEHRALFSNMMNPTGFGLILQEITTSYKFPLKYPDTVLVAHKLSEPMSAESTFMTVEALIISKLHQRIAARFTEKISFYDYKAAKVARVPTPLLRLMEDRTAELSTIQQESRQRVRDLEAKVDQFVKSAA